jgi:hypothetical protein
LGVSKVFEPISIIHLLSNSKTDVEIFNTLAADEFIGFRVGQKLKLQPKLEEIVVNVGKNCTHENF